MNSITIDQLNINEYWGVIIDDKLTFSNHVAYIKSKIFPKLKVLNKLKYILSIKTKLRLYKSLIVLLFDYGDVICSCLMQKDSAIL